MNREAAHQRQEAATLRLSGARLSLEGRLQIADVWIAGPNIRSIGEPPPDITPDGVEDLRCDGLTCVPGQIDLHVHACAAGRGMVEDLHTCLLRGITTVRDLGGPLAVLGQVPVWADKLGMTIPRLARAGPILTARGGHPVSTILAGLSSLAGAAAVQLDDANAARAEVRHLSQASVDLIKVAFSSRRASRPDIVVPRLALGILAASSMRPPATACLWLRIRQRPRMFWKQVELECVASNMARSWKLSAPRWPPSWPSDGLS